MTISVSRYVYLFSIIVIMSGFSQLAAAQNVCKETVPADHYVDGIPAYAQCDASMNSSIYSDNGINTSVTSLGPEWVSTQRSGGYQCTEYANRYLRFTWDVVYRGGWARDWCDGNLPATLVKNTIPVHGDVVVFIPGACGADSSAGHVAVVDTVDMASSRFTFVEQNRSNRRRCDISSANCFLHVVANNGSSIDSGIVVDAGWMSDGGLTDGGAVGTVPDGAYGSDGASGNSTSDSAVDFGDAGGVDSSAGVSGQTSETGGVGGYGADTVPVTGDNSSVSGSPDISGRAGSVETATADIGDSGAIPEDPGEYRQEGCSCNLAEQRRHRKNVWIFFMVGLALLVAYYRNTRHKSRLTS